MAEKNANSRYRNFATVVYPESASDNWLDLLQDLKVPTFVSPLHDQDVNPDGQPKKAHYHVMLMYDGKKSEEQARADISTFGGVGCEVVKNTRSYARYLTHKDNPDKAQYNDSDVKAFGGADYFSVCGSVADKYVASTAKVTTLTEQKKRLMITSDLKQLFFVLRKE